MTWVWVVVLGLIVYVSIGAATIALLNAVAADRDRRRGGNGVPPWNPIAAVCTIVFWPVIMMVIVISILLELVVRLMGVHDQ